MESLLCRFYEGNHLRHDKHCVNTLEVIQETHCWETEPEYTLVTAFSLLSLEINSWNSFRAHFPT